MQRKLFVFALGLVAAFSVVSVASAAGGFDQFGYNRTARIFNGPASGWCLQRGASADCLGVYSNDKLVMKWNAEWDRGNAEGWTKAPYAAWLDNEWNGNVPNGSGATEHFKTAWDAGCVESGGTTSSRGGPCIWGQFAVLMDQGNNPGGGHEWWTKVTPNGYGAH